MYIRAHARYTVLGWMLSSIIYYLLSIILFHCPLISIVAVNKPAANLFVALLKVLFLSLACYQCIYLLGWVSQSIQSLSGVWLWDPMDWKDARLPCPSPTPRACSNSCPSSWWCHSTISSSVIPFSSCLQSFPTSEFFPVSQFFALGGQSIEASASTSVLPMISFRIDWFDLLAVQGILNSITMYLSVDFFFLEGHTKLACKISVSQLGVKPRTPAMEMWSLNHWTTWEVPEFLIMFIPFVTHWAPTEPEKRCFPHFWKT